MKKLILGTLLMAGVMTVANANMITNGDFETGDLTGWDYSYNDATVVDTGTSYGYAALLGGSATVGISALAQDFYIDPSIGSIVVEFDYLFDGKDTAWLYDDGFLAGLVTLEGTSFFDINLEVLVLESSTDANFGTAVHFSGIFDISNIDGTLDPNALLGFGLLETSAYWWDKTNTSVYIDNVSVSASSVPEPSIIALFGLGLVGMGFAGRRRISK